MSLTFTQPQKEADRSFLSDGDSSLDLGWFHLSRRGQHGEEFWAPGLRVLTMNPGETHQSRLILIVPVRGTQERSRSQSSKHLPAGKPVTGLFKSLLPLNKTRNMKQIFYLRE